MWFEGRYSPRIDPPDNVMLNGGKLEAHQPWKLVDGRLDLKDMNEEAPAILHPTATAPRMKIHAARHFLELLTKHVRNEAAVVTYADALSSALRSATWALKKASAHKEGFIEWYAQREAEMRDDA